MRPEPLKGLTNPKNLLRVAVLQFSKDFSISKIYFYIYIYMYININIELILTIPLFVLELQHCNNCISLMSFLPDADAVGRLAVEGALLDVEGFVPAVHVGDHAVHALLAHRVTVGAVWITLSESQIVDVSSVVL